MKELGITKGEWKSEELFGDLVVRTSNEIIVDMASINEDEDAALIADAGNTAQKCGLLPSELLKQRDELLEAMNRIVDPIKYMMLDLRKDESLDGQTALSLSRNVEYLRNIAKAAIKSTER